MTTVITAADPAITDAKYASVTLLKETKVDIDDTLKVLEKTEPKDTVLMNDLMALSSEVVTAANAWQATDLGQLQTKSKELRDKYETYRPRVPIVSGFAVTTGQNILAMLIAFAVLFGGIIGGHMFIDAPVMKRLFYFIYGAALFPFTLLAAAYSPPLWRATIFPWVEGTKGVFSFITPSPLDKPSGTFRYISVALLTTLVAFYFFLYERLPV